MKTNEYHKQAEQFLAAFNISFSARLSNTKAPAWKSATDKCGNHYRITLSKPLAKSNSRAFDLLKNGKVVDTVFYSGPGNETAAEVLKSYVGHDGGDADDCRKCRRSGKRITFDFWGSIADKESGQTTLPAYDVLACISGDVYCPDNFKDFCADYGDNADSIKALALFRRCSRFAARLREFFTAAELEKLAEIQ